MTAGLVQGHKNTRALCLFNQISQLPIQERIRSAFRTRRSRTSLQNISPTLVQVHINRRRTRVVGPKNCRNTLALEVVWERLEDRTR